MKKFLAILILILTVQTPSQADDIRDFQIEGMSIGDSLLDYFSEDKINAEAEAIYPSSDKFLAVTFRNLPKFKFYDGVQFNYKKNDGKYIILGFNGQRYYNDIKECKKEYKKAVKKLSEAFSNAKKYDQGRREHAGLAEAGNKGNFYFRTLFVFESGAAAAVVCYDWKEESDRQDGLGIYLNTNEYLDFIENEAYK